MVTLRRERMWEFLDRLVNIALPRVRDFRGVSPRGFDGRGNFTMGVSEQIIFPEIEYDKIDSIKGMNISIVTTAETDAEGPRASRAPRHAVPPGRAGHRRTGARSCSMSKLVDRLPKKHKFKVRIKSRCKRCGRSRAYLRKFEMCRLCFRELALRGDIPGVIKSSW